MPAVGIYVKIGRVDDMRPQGVQMDVADKFLEIDVFLTDNGFVSILKKLTRPVITAIEKDGISCKETSHEAGDAWRTASEKKVGMIRYQCPSIARCPGLRQKRGKTFYEIVTVAITPEDVLSLYSPDHDVMQCSCGIKSGCTRHMSENISRRGDCQLKY